MNRLIKEMISILNADNIILGYSELKAKNVVNLNVYHPEYHSKGDKACINNLGDYLSKIVVEFMCKKEGFTLDDLIGGKKQHLYAIGSILLMGYQNCTVWGTGLPFVPGTLRGIPHRRPLRSLT